jgi:drug/metabolite transporter (DMT)-like permease
VSHSARTVAIVRSVGTVQCATVMVVLGFSFPISRELLSYPVLTGQAMRYAVAATVLAAVLGARRAPVRPAPAELWRLCAIGATGLAAFNVCVLETLRRADPAVVGTAVGAAPIALALLGPLTRGHRPAVRLTAAAAVVVAGTALVYGAGDMTVAGLAWASGAFAGEVAFSLIAAPLLARLGPTRVSAYACGFAVPVLLAAALVVGERWRPPALAETAALAFLALVLTAGMFPLWYAGVHRLTVERAGMFTGLLPVVSLLATSALDRALPPWSQLAGVLLVGAGLTAGLATRPAADRRPDRYSARH